MIFETVGDKSKPVITMINGSFCTGKGLMPIAERISDKYYIILPTYDGHHENGGIFTTRQEQANKIIDYLRKENIKKIELIQGVSMGAEVALTLASTIFRTTDIVVDRYLLDGGPFFKFPKWFRKIMQMKFKSMVHNAQYGTEEEIIERFSNNKMIQWMLRGDISPYKWYIKDMSLAAPHMTDESICNESDACYTFDFPEMPDEEQKKIYFTWSDNEPAVKSKKKLLNHYPHAVYGSAGNLGHGGLMSREPDKYAELIAKLAEEKIK